MAAGLSLISTVPTLSAPANGTAISQAAAEIGIVTEGALLVHLARTARLLPPGALLALVTRLRRSDIRGVR